LARVPRIDLQRLSENRAPVDWTAKLSPRAREYIAAQTTGPLAPLARELRAPSSSSAQQTAREIARRSAERDQQRRIKRQRSDEQWMEARRRKLPPRPGSMLTIIPPKLWEQSAICMSSRTGRAHWYRLARCKNRAAAGAIRRAAFARGARDWSSSYARNVIVVGLALLELAHSTRRKSRWRLAVQGIQVDALCALLQDPETGHKPHRNTLSGTHRADADLENAQFGYLRALAAAGFCYAQQERQCADDPSINRYWIVCSLGLAYTGAATPSLLELVQESYELEHARPGRAPPAA
jgi:hypothetical protein